MYKTIIFDLDGTLLNTKTGIIKAIKITINQLKLEMLSDKILDNFIGPPMHDSMEKYFNLDKRTAMEYANIFKENYRKYSLFEAVLYDGVLDLLQILKEKNCNIAVATSKTHENAMILLEKFGVLKYCNYAIGTDLECKLSKTNLVEKCIEFFKTPHNECVLIGDSSADAIGAKNNNIAFIGVLYGFGFTAEADVNEYPNVLCVKNPREILNLLKNM